MDLAQQSPEYMEELAKHHVGGHLKVAPEHTDTNVLRLMKKPDANDYQGFAEAFQKASEKAGKKQFLVPYYIASHPGSDLNAMIDLAVFLKRNGYRPTRFRTSSPPRSTSPPACSTPGSTRSPARKSSWHATCRDRKLQRALLQFFKPENYFEVRKALHGGRPARPDRRGLRLP